MKLIECHISGFGAFNDYKVSFDEGFNVILQPNGWGKTTLAAYIKAMLYGFDRKRTRDLTENERLRYKPWHGGKYGGTLDFEFGGKEYRILRSFGATGSADQLKVVDIACGQAVDLAGQEPGEWVFGLDAPAFQKSIFAGQNGMAFDGSTSALRNRLNSFVNEVDDTAGLDKALAELDERRKHYVKQGGHGRIADISQDMADLLGKQKLQNAQVDEVLRLHARISELDGQIQGLRRQEDGLAAQLDEARKGERDAAALTAAREQLVARRRQAQEAQAEFLSHNGTLPSAEDVERLRELDAAIARSRKEEADAQAEARAAQASLDEIRARYAGNVPTRADLEDKRAKLAEAARRQASLGADDADGRRGAAANPQAEDPSFADKAKDLLDAWTSVQVQLERGKEAEVRRREAQAAWGERKRAVQAGLDEAERCDRAVPPDVDEQLRSVSQASESLRAATAERARHAADLDALQAQLARAQAYDGEAAGSTAKQGGGVGKAVVSGVLAVVGIMVAIFGIATLAAPLSYALAGVGLVLAVLGCVLLVRVEKARGARDRERQDWQAQARARLEGLQAEVAAAQGQVEACDAQIASLLGSAGLSACDAADVAAAPARLEMRRAELDKALHDAQDARRRLAGLLANMPAGAVEATADPLAAAKALLSGDTAPGCEELDQAVEAARGAGDEYARKLSPILEALGTSPSGDLALDVERGRQALLAFEEGRREAAERSRQIQAAQSELDALVGELGAWAATMGLAGGAEALTEDALEGMARDAAAAEKAAWQASQAEERAAKARREGRDLSKTAEQSLAKLDVPASTSLLDAADLLAARLTRRDGLSHDLQAAECALVAWDREHAGEPARTHDGAACAQSAEIQSRLEALARQREELSSEQARCETQREALLRSLEELPRTAQQIRLLSAEKQRATSNLFVVQKTAEYLKRAREALDRRYLGGLSERFNDYTTSWLEGDAMSVDVGVDFDVTVHQDGGTHEAASYSSGYQDLLDICLRMALVDTIFESEQPFIVMDDPFVNLDQANLGRALTLLALLARGRQIVYLTCHPSRTQEGSVGSEAAFTLPAQRPSRELPRARAKREAQERERAQAELVASYRVTGVTQGRANLCLAGPQKPITSNMTALRFATSDAGKRDNAFEVHFIDARGRSLCERQTVEVIDGRVVPEQVRFRLSTRPDSGEAFDLIVHEQGKPETELAARVPFRSAVSFSTSDFDM